MLEKVGFLLLKSMMLLTLENGILPIKSVLSLEGPSPKAGTERTGLWFTPVLFSPAVQPQEKHQVPAVWL